MVKFLANEGIGILAILVPFACGALVYYSLEDRIKRAWNSGGDIGSIQGWFYLFLIVFSGIVGFIVVLYIGIWIES